jgi:CHASE2 domain-containing sensor protein
MKTLCTILIVILTIVLGRWIIIQKYWFFDITTSFYFMFLTGIFSYGVYKILEFFEE